MADVVRIELGTSTLEAGLIVQQATAAGLQVELLRNDHPEMAAAFALGGCAVLVAAADESDLRELLAESGF